MFGGVKVMAFKLKTGAQSTVVAASCGAAVKLSVVAVHWVNNEEDYLQCPALYLILTAGWMELWHNWVAHMVNWLNMCSTFLVIPNVHIHTLNWAPRWDRRKLGKKTPQLSDCKMTTLPTETQDSGVKHISHIWGCDACKNAVLRKSMANSGLCAPLLLVFLWLHNGERTSNSRFITTH